MPPALKMAVSKTDSIAAERDLIRPYKPNLGTPCRRSLRGARPSSSARTPTSSRRPNRRSRWWQAEARVAPQKPRRRRGRRRTA
ncbi:hypothetical protein EE612_017294 [Oryza sativa]|nr:hypothetical protein EE612_017294 [Oryza sativa]